MAPGISAKRSIFSPYNPEVWKKPFSFLTYDEKRRVFRPCAAFVAPHPGQTGDWCGIRRDGYSLEYVADGQQQRDPIMRGSVHRSGVPAFPGDRLTLEPWRLGQFTGLRSYLYPAIPGKISSHKTVRRSVNRRSAENGVVPSAATSRPYSGPTGAKLLKRLNPSTGMHSSKRYTGAFLQPTRQFPKTERRDRGDTGQPV